MFRLSSVSSKLLLSVAISVILATALMIALFLFKLLHIQKKKPEILFYYLQKDM